METQRRFAESWAARVGLSALIVSQKHVSAPFRQAALKTRISFEKSAQSCGIEALDALRWMSMAQLAQVTFGHSQSSASQHFFELECFGTT